METSPTCHNNDDLAMVQRARQSAPDIERLETECRLRTAEADKEAERKIKETGDANARQKQPILDELADIDDNIQRRERETAADREKKARLVQKLKEIGEPDEEVKKIEAEREARKEEVLRYKVLSWHKILLRPRGPSSTTASVPEPQTLRVVTGAEKCGDTSGGGSPQAPPRSAGNRTKKRAATAREGDGLPAAYPGKQRRVTGEDPDVQVSRTISFDEVYQDGHADRSYEIVKYPQGNQGRWYILHCTKHNLGFGTKTRAVHAARKHVDGKEHGGAANSRRSAWLSGSSAYLC